MARAFLLSESDIRVLQHLLERERNRTPERPRLISEQTLIQTPEVHIFRTPAAGIPALTVGNDTGTGTGYGGGFGDDIPGEAYCEIYKVRDVTGSEEMVNVPGVSKIVRNLSPVAIPGNAWIAAMKDKFGTWLAIPPASYSDSESWTGTATDAVGTGTSGGTLTFVSNVCPIYEDIEADTGTGTPTTGGGSYTDEMAQDALGAILVDSATIDFTYNDVMPSIEASVIDNSITYSKIQEVSAAARLLGRGNGAGAGDVEEITTADGLAILGTTLSCTITQYTDEGAQDAVGGILVDSATIDFTYDDITPSITASVIDGSISDTKLRSSAALSLIGRASNSAGSPADIAAASDGQVMRRSGTTIGFGAVDLASANAVTGLLPVTNLATLNGFTDLTAQTLATDDRVPIYDTSATANRDCAVSDFVYLIQPPGTIAAFGGSSVPSGWLECDGSAVSRTTYADLFAAVSTTWGTGNGTTTFNVPDLRGRAVIGAGTGSGLTARTLGTQNIGAETHTLTTSEMPSHTHGPTSGNTHIVMWGGSGAMQRGSGTADMQALVATSSTGSDGAHANMQPSAVVKWIIKT